MPNKWVSGIVHGTIGSDGSIIAATEGLTVRHTSKPSNPREARKVGQDFDAAWQIKNRVPGPFRFTAHFGGAIVVPVPWKALTKLDYWRMGHLLRKFFGSTGFPKWVAIMHVRNLGAPAVQSAAEPSGGMAETENLLVEQVFEIAELGIKNSYGGWVNVILPGQLRKHQARFDAEQRHVRGCMVASSPHWGTHVNEEVRLKMVPVGKDTLNGTTGIVTAGPVGDIELVILTQLRLTGMRYRFFDMETHNGAPMCRRIVAIAPRVGKSPVVIQLDTEGKIDDFGLHFVLDGENRTGALAYWHGGARCA